MSDEWLRCAICPEVGYMAEPTHSDPCGVLVYCCWRCRTYMKTTIKKKGYIDIHEWIELEKNAMKKRVVPTETWDDITPPGGIVIDPKYKP